MDDDTGQATPQEGQQPPARGEVVGYVDSPRVVESFIPASQLAPLMEAHVGKMKAELHEEFKQKLDQISHLPSLTQLIITNIVTIAGGLGLFFGVAAYFGDRQDTAIERSSSVSGALSRIEGKLDESVERIEGLEDNAKNNPGESQGARQTRPVR